MVENDVYSQEEFECLFKSIGWGYIERRYYLYGSKEQKNLWIEKANSE